MDNNGGTAFPVPETTNGSGVRFEASNVGMTLRDYFAAQALIAIVGKPSQGVPMAEPHRRAAELAYIYADAMITARGN